MVHVATRGNLSLVPNYSKTQWDTLKRYLQKNPTTNPFCQSEKTCGGGTTLEWQSKAFSELSLLFHRVLLLRFYLESKTISAERHACKASVWKICSLLFAYLEFTSKCLMEFHNTFHDIYDIRTLPGQ